MKSKANRHALSGGLRELDIKSSQYSFRKMRTIILNQFQQGKTQHHHDTYSIREVIR